MPERTEPKRPKITKELTIGEVSERSGVCHSPRSTPLSNAQTILWSVLTVRALMGEMVGAPMDAQDVSARIGEAVRGERLGGHRATYPAVLVSTTGLRVGGVVAAVAAVLALIGLATGVIVLVVLGAIFAVVLGYRIVRLALLNRQKEGQQLHFFEHGLVCVGVGGRITVRRWDSTTVFQNTVRHYRNGAYTGTTYSYRLIGPAGDTLGLAGGFERPAEWGQAIQQAVTDAQLPGAAATIQAGGTLTFGDISINRETVGASGKSVPWSQIQEIRVKDGLVSLRVQGRWLSLTTTMVRSIPNFFVFYALAERLRLSAAGPY
ncbi:hypothetical protein NE236_00085 [Actinoallomurus purpureus]|uniref:DUF6585 family protein n=1 Tax=Actinoallomurus purpureus TaxID=478114 RepID=UPI002092B361|nr:DUF6585 family protein [Actinoallomurus purpureus]MCO6003375.1 hypothetical protein [Actinoallomurus purpureus]